MAKPRRKTDDFLERHLARVKAATAVELNPNVRHGTVCLRWRTPRERRTFERAAKQAGMTRSSYARMLIVEALKLPDDAS